MKILQWSMTIPVEKQGMFARWFKESAGPVLCNFGAIKHEMYKVADRQTIGKQLTEQNRFIERIYFDDGFDVSSYFVEVKENLEAYKLSLMYEQEFGATDIELRFLEELS